MRDSPQDSSSDNQIKTLAAIDTAQVWFTHNPNPIIHPPPPQKQGILPWVTSEDNQRALSLSKYGIKVTDIKKQRVYQRHPLHWIANITYYEDTYGKHMVVLRQSKPERATGDPQDLFIYECVQEVGSVYCLARGLRTLASGKYPHFWVYIHIHVSYQNLAFMLNFIGSEMVIIDDLLFVPHAESSQRHLSDFGSSIWSSFQQNETCAKLA